MEPLSPSIFPKDRNETFNIAFLFNDDFVIDPEGAVSARILVVEDNKDMREYLQEVMDDAGYDSLTAADGLEAMTIIENDKEMIDLLITDVRMPGMQGGELLSLMRAKRSEAPVVVITAFGSIEQAVELVKQGAYQYLTKPFETSDLLSTVADALEKTELQRQQAWERRKAPSKPQKIVGVSRPMQAMFDMMMAAARSSGTVLIIGESGTGKELVARAIHEMSGRKGAFVPVNCAAIPDDLVESEMFGHIGGAFTGARQAREGLVESANGGTLFLDEIGELPLSVQPKLLRALQNGSVRRVGSNTEKQVDIRVLAATNRDLEQDVAEGRFREDLYWRLNVIKIKVPPLRERAMDIPLLVDHFIAITCKSNNRAPLDVSPEALACLTAYSWPGNVRELENAIERAVIFCPGSTLDLEFLPERIRSKGENGYIIARSSERNLSLREIEREYIFEMLRRTGGNKKKAAEFLGMDRKTLYRKLDEYKTADEGGNS